MEDSRKIKQVIEILKKNILLIIISGILVSGIFMSSKYIFKSSYTLAPSDDIIIEESLRIDDYKDKNDIFRYDKYLKSPSFLSSFIDATKNDFNYNQLVPGWEKKTMSQKIDWFNKHFIISYYGAGRYGIQLSIKRSDPVDLEYIQKNGKKFVEAFIDFADHSDSFGDYTVTSSVNSIPEAYVISEDKVIVKYGIIGFVLGVIGMSTILLVWNMGKCYHGKR